MECTPGYYNGEGKPLCRERFTSIQVVSHKSVLDYSDSNEVVNHLVVSYGSWSVEAGDHKQHGE